ncbi:MAG TPA: glycosyltransferase family 61 protein [Acidimicrobiales bacterium]|nr:glycosyltransferase family 61 protein [Acidimicrobiales bacterium]
MLRLPPALRPLWPLAKVAYTAVTRTVAPFTTLISRTVGTDGVPLRAVLTAEEAVAPGNGGGRLFAGRSPETARRTLPEGIPAGHPVFKGREIARIPRSAVLELPAARALGVTGAVVTRTGALVVEVSPYFGTSRPTEHPVFLHPFLAKPEPFDGRLAVLATRGDSIYYHFLLDVLPRLDTLDRCQELSRPDAYYVPAQLPFQRQLLAELGVGTAAIFDSSLHPHVRASTLVVPGLPDVNMETPSWVIGFLRERLLPRMPQGPRRRLYVTRGTRRNTRRVINEDQVLDMLAIRGFERIDAGSLPIRAQIEAFAQAEIIVAPHGSALANLVFASPGTLIVELFAPDYVNVCYWVLAQHVSGLRYRYLVGGDRRVRPERMRGVSSDITVDVDRLAQLLDGGRGGPRS